MTHDTSQAFESKFLSTAGSNRANRNESRSVLYVDESPRLAAVTEYVDREGLAVPLVGTSDIGAARRVLAEGAWACLVLGDVPDATRDELRGVADCPVVAFTEASAAVEGEVETAVDPDGDDAVAILVDAVADHVGSPAGSIPSLDETVDAAADGSITLFLVDEDGTVAWSSEPFEAAFPAEEPDDRPATGDFYDRVAAIASDVPTGFRSAGGDAQSGDDVLRIPGEDGDRVYRHERHRIPATGGERRLELFEDVSVNHRRERPHPVDRDELADVELAYAILSGVVRDLGDATDRENLTAAVCDHLVGTDEFALAWTGQREGGSDRVVPATVAGEPEGYLREVVETTSVEDARGGPVLAAVSERQIQVVQNVSEAEMVTPWRDVALSYDLHSLAVVPLIHGETVHGVLVVYGNEPDAFDDAVVGSLRLVGEAVGFALTAIHNERLLKRNVTLELAFRSRSEDAYLVGVAGEADCRLTTTGTIDVGGDGVLQYVQVDGASAGCVAEAVEERNTDRTARVVRNADEGSGLVEVHGDGSLHDALTDAGARLREAVATPSGTRVVAEASTDADVRAIQAAVSRFNPGAELVCKTELTSSQSNDGSVRAPVESLTDRQAEVLRAAFLAGYYAWPRDTTAEELADSLGIASPTLHQHLRRAEYNLLESLFDECDLDD